MAKGLDLAMACDEFLNFESDVRVRIPTPWPFGAAPSDAHSVWREKVD